MMPPQSHQLAPLGSSVVAGVVVGADVVGAAVVGLSVGASVVGAAVVGLGVGAAVGAG